MPEDSQTQAEEVVVRFRTTRPLGLLLATSLENSVDKLQISLEDAKAKLLLRIGDREKVNLRLLSIRRKFMQRSQKCTSWDS